MDLIERIKYYEGLRLKPYQCPAGKWTVGYGRNLEDKGITEQEALFLLHNDIAECAQACQKNFAFFENLSQMRQGVLIEMVYNMGFSKVKEFKKMLLALQGYDYERAAQEMLDSVWARQVKSRAKKLSMIMKRGWDI